MGGFGWRESLEILIFWVAIYGLLRSLKGTRGLGVLKGTVGFIIGLYLFSKVLDERLGISLSRLTFVIENLATAALLAVVIIFQPEVRRGLTRLGERPFSWLAGRGASRGVSPIVDAAGRLSRRRIGALIVIERSIGISGVIENGVPLTAKVSAPLIETIFYPRGPLHDGAIVMRGDTIVAASCLLPLSDDPSLGKELGTRHRAAVGISEETDAAVLVVSEETGRLSVAFRGHIRPMRDVRELEGTLTMILSGEEPEWAMVAGAAAADAADADDVEPEREAESRGSGPKSVSVYFDKNRGGSPSASDSGLRSIQRAADPEPPR